MNETRGGLLLGSALFASLPTVADVPLSRYPPWELDPGAGTSREFLCVASGRPVEPNRRVRRRQRSSNGGPSET